MDIAVSPSSSPLPAEILGEKPSTGPLPEMFLLSSVMLELNPVDIIHA